MIINLIGLLYGRHSQLYRRLVDKKKNIAND